MSRNAGNTKAWYCLISLISLRYLGVLCVSAVNPSREKLAAETQRPQRMRREKLKSKHCRKSIELARIFVATNALDDYQPRS